jgi:hypothetical protein
MDLLKKQKPLNFNTVDFVFATQPDHVHALGQERHSDMGKLKLFLAGLTLSWRHMLHA